MNAKTAKALRREAMYHPNQPREYETVNQSRRLKTKRVKVGGKWTEVPTQERKQGTIELNASCSRYLYQQLKKELNNP